eukprot:m.36904 g.36904  ORF g.36904 m.36904 type:complete len:974 (+) comp6706_c0_seq2:109-3030(+)
MSDVEFDTNYVVQLLEESCNVRDANARQEATKTLEALEVKPGFFSVLETIFSPTNADTVAEDLRISAIIYFKNASVRLWRRSSPRGPNDEEKGVLRERLLLSLQEPSNKMALQFGVLLGILARQDVPSQWPQFLEELVAGMSNENPLIRRRSIFYTYKAVKKIITRRLASQYRRFAEVATEMYPYVLQPFQDNVVSAVDKLNDLAAVEDMDVLEQDLQLALDSLKALRQLTANALMDIEQLEFVQTFLSLLPELAQRLFECGEMLQSSDEPPQIIIMLIFKLIKQSCKALIDVQAKHPLPFCAMVLQDATNFFLPFVQKSQPSSEEEKSDLSEIITLKALYFLRNIVRERLYKDDLEPSSDLHRQAQEVASSVFNVDAILQLVDIVAQNFLGMNPEEIEGIEDDPSTYVATDYGDGWIFNTHASGEKLFFELVSNYKNLVCPYVNDLASSFDQCETLNQFNARINMLKLGAYSLYDYVDINVLASTLVGIFTSQQASPEGFGIQRRVLQVLAAWVPIRLSQESRVILYELLCSVFNGSSPMYVRMAAVNALTDAVNDVEMELEQIQPFSESLFEGVCSLLATSTDSDQRLAIMDTITNMVNKLEDEAHKFKSALVQYIPQLWEEASEQGNNLLTARIVDLMNALVTATGLSEGLESIIVPVVRLGADQSNEASVYLLDNTLDLWFSYMEKASECTEDIQDLFSLLLPLFDLGDESLLVCMRIFNSYLLIAHSELLSSQSISIVVSAFEKLLDVVPRRAFQTLTKMMDTTLLLCPEECLVALAPILVSMLSMIVEKNESYFSVATITLLCRVAIRSVDAFMTILSSVNGNPLEALDDLVDLILEQSDNITVKTWRKIIALAILVLLEAESTRDVLLTRMNGLMSLEVGIVTNLHTIAGELKDEDSLVLSGEPDQVDDNEAHRLFLVCMGDPVFTVGMREQFSASISAIRANCGDEPFHAMDEAIAQQVSDLLIA